MKRVSFYAALVFAALLSACASKPPTTVLAMSQTDRGVMIWLPDNVLFAFGKSDLSGEAKPYLARVGKLLNEKTDHKLILEGHTDNVGNVTFNQKLSEDRAQTVADALTALKVDASRLEVIGLGLSKPLAPNDTETGRRLNRRVELIVLDETIENLTRGEPSNSFEDAFARLKAEVDAMDPTAAGEKP